MDLLIDSHAHLTDKAFGADLAESLERAATSGVERVIAVSEDLDDAERAADVARRFDMVHSTAGVHPHRADGWTGGSGERLQTIVEAARPVAIGEIGLDYHYAFSTRENQQRVFREQLRLARELGLPFVVHCRESEGDLIEILESEKPYPKSGVVHCFNGTAELAERILALGLYIGIGGMVTFRKADALRAVVARVIPPGRVLVETDAPYLAPEPKRGRKNEPAYVRYTAERLAEVYGIESAELAAQTRRSTLSLFGLGPEIPRDSIAYQLGNALYLNLTNRCTNECVFCARNDGCSLAGYDLRLEREPTVGEIVAAIGNDPSEYDEVVFCGYGEPTYRIESILWVGRWLKQRGVGRIRLNTNGHANVINGRSVIDELAEVIDVVSVSLNAATEEEYARLCRPVEPRFNLEAVCAFLSEARAAFAEVVATAVAYPGLDVEACCALAEERLGIRFQRRPF